MAAPEYQYYNIPSHAHQISPVKNDVRVSPTSIVMPKLPQPFTPQEQQIQNYQNHGTPTSTIRRSKFEHDHYRPYPITVPQSSTTDKNHHQPFEHRKLLNRPGSRSEHLKRRSSWREAARALQPSNVAKRLRRQAQSSGDQDDEDDTSASASESDYSGDTLCEPGAGFLQESQHRRGQSIVSEIANGLEDSLNLNSFGRERGSSSASQSSIGMMDNSDTASTNTSFTTLSTTSNRKRSMDEDGPDGDEEGDSDQARRRSGPISSLGLEQPQLFACPFAKQDPQRYSAANLDELNYRGCAQSYLTDLARVKQHLYRVHERPQYHCSRCYEVFKSQAQCIKHVSSELCVPRPCPFDEKMSQEQLTAIKKKNRGTDPYLGWYEIYKTLFPGAQLPMSPYAAFTANMDTLESFMDFVMRELPTRLQMQTDFSTPSHDAIRASLPNVLRDIRRDFNPQMQYRPEAISQPIADGVQSDTGDPKTSLPPNFHQMVTMEVSNSSQIRPSRPSIIDLPPPNSYGYVPAQSTQIISGSIPAQPHFHTQQTQNNLNSNYMYEQFSYNIPNPDVMQDVRSGPPTAIWQPDDRETIQGYFFPQQQVQALLPTHLIQVENEGNWIPNMITSRVDQSMNNPGVQDMMGGLFPSGFSQQQR